MSALSNLVWHCCHQLPVRLRWAHQWDSRGLWHTSGRLDHFPLSSSTDTIHAQRCSQIGQCNLLSASASHFVLIGYLLHSMCPNPLLRQLAALANLSDDIVDCGMYGALYTVGYSLPLSSLFSDTTTLCTVV